MKFWIKLDRLAAWILLACMILYFISGYGMTKGLIDSKLALNLHDIWLPIVVIISFCIHGAFATRLAFIRWGIWNILIKIIWCVIFVSFLCGFLYVEIFYKETKNTTKNSISNTVTSSNSNTQVFTSSTSSSAVSSTNLQKIYTADTLSVYNAKNGQPSYVAIDGVVYDVSTLFVDGTHYGCSAGQDVTSAFDAEKKHKQVILDNYPIVGTYQ